MTWPTVMLGDCGDIQGGLQVSSKRIGLPISRPYLRVANVHRGRLDLSEVKTIDATQAEVNRTELRVGDLLFVEGHANPQEVGRVAVWDGSIPTCVHQNHLIRFRPDPGILLPQYAARWFNAPAGARHFQRAGRTTSGLNTIGASTVRSAPTLLPSLGEQRRIAALLDRADGLRAKRTEVFKRFADLSESIHRQSYLSPSTVVKLGEICEVKGGKRLPKGAPYAMTPTTHPYIRVSDMRQGRISLGDLKFIDDEIHSAIARYTVGPEDVVISIAGSIGLTATVPAELVGANLTENAARITPRDLGLYRSGWLAAALRTPVVASQIRSHTGQVTIGKLALFRIEQLELELPPLAVQDQYLREFRSIESARIKLEQMELDGLFASLQSRAFSGQM